MRWVPLWVVAALIFFGFYFARRRRYTLIDLTDGKSLFFLRDRPSKKKLEAFLSEMFSARNSYLRKTYSRIDADNDPQHELARFQWLLSEGVIDDDEYQSLKHQLNAEESEHDLDETGKYKPRPN